MKFCLDCEKLYIASSWVCPNCGWTPDIRYGIVSFAPELSSDAGFKDSLFDELVELEARNFWFRTRNRLIAWALFR